MRRRNIPWGLWVALASAILTIAALAFRPVQGHYLSYTVPSLYLWRGANPYGIDFPGAQGHFHYAPSAALYFFSLFAFFPPLLGELLYLSFQLALYIYALRRLLMALRYSLNWDVFAQPWRNLFWLMISSELVGSLLGIKVEVTITALAFLSLAFLIEGRSSLWAGLLLGLGTALNFQPLPIVGLLAVVLWITRRDGAFFASWLLTTLAVTAAALLVLPLDFAREVFHSWIVATSEFTEQAWLAPIFQTAYRFVHVWTGATFSLARAQLVGAFIGGGMALFLAGWLRRTSEPRSTELGILAAGGMGAAFCVVFYPLSQSNAYSLYAPLLPAVWIFSKHLPISKRALGGCLIAAYLFISILYSDFAPRPVYRWVYDHAFKPLGVLGLLGLLLWAMARSQQVTGRRRTASS